MPLTTPTRHEVQRGRRMVQGTSIVSTPDYYHVTILQLEFEQWLNSKSSCSSSKSIISQMTPAQYLISLCTTAQQLNQSFGLAIRIGASNPKFQFETTKVIHSILMFSPAPDTMAVEFLNELEKVKGISFLGKCSLHSCILLLIQARTVKPVLDRASPFDCSTWATKIIDYLRDNFSPSQRFEVLGPVTDLATAMLSHLLIASITVHPHA